MSKPDKLQPRHSLQPHSSQLPVGPLRHTKSHNYERRSKKKAIANIPTIHEAELGENGEHETVESGEAQQHEKRSSRDSVRGTKKAGYDNAAFEGSTGNLTDSTSRHLQRSSMQHSFISNSSAKNPSVRSLPVIREQYCCCSRWSSCEKILISVVAVLAVVIVGLVIAISFLATDKGDGIDTQFNWSL